MLAVRRQAFGNAGMGKSRSRIRHALLARSKAVLILSCALQAAATICLHGFRAPLSSRDLYRPQGLSNLIRNALSKLNATSLEMLAEQPGT